MKKLNLKHNYLLNLLRILTATIVSLVMMPYVNKILGVQNIGKVEYAYTIAIYFVLFSGIGVPIYGIRAIAQVRNNILERSKITLELFTILFFMTILSYLILYVILFHLNLFVEYKTLIILLSSMVLLTNIGGEWYFQGMENQSFLTIRYVSVRIISIIVLFLFVKTSDDLLIYCMILIINNAGSNIFNIFFIIRSISFKEINFKKLNFLQHASPILKIFIATISINIYAQLDNLMIGSIAGDKYLALYTVPNKLIRYIISFITVIGIVMLPEISRLWLGDKEKYYEKLKQALSLILLISLPFCGYFLVFASQIIHVMGGEGFKESIKTMRILSPLCVIVGLAYFYGYLLLYTQKKEFFYTLSVVVSALLSVLINFFSIRYMQQNGAALTQIFVEMLAVLAMLIFSRKQLFSYSIPLKEVIKMIFATVISQLSCYYLLLGIDQSLYNLMLYSIIYFVIYLVAILMVKENNITSQKHLLKKIYKVVK